MSRVLITGGAGFIGSHLAERLHQEAQVVVLDDLRSGFERNLAGVPCDFIRGSILERDLVRRALRNVDWVFHLAAFVSVPESVQKPEECARINVEGTLLLLEEAAQAGVKKLVLSSSAAIYGDNPAIPKLETMAPEPKSPYAASKLAAENHCAAFTERGSLATVCLRYFNVFGPRQDPKSQYAAAIPMFIERALARQPLTIYGDGRQTRDFIHVKEVVSANLFFAASPATGVFNVACGRQTTIAELAEEIRALAGSSSEIRFAAERAGDVKHSVASIARLHAAGFAPACDFQEGLKDTIEFYRRRSAAAPYPPASTSGYNIS